MRRGSGAAFWVPERILLLSFRGWVETRCLSTTGCWVADLGLFGARGERFIMSVLHACPFCWSLRVILKPVFVSLGGNISAIRGGSDGFVTPTGLNLLKSYGELGAFGLR